jgi:hypothetical protein
MNALSLAALVFDPEDILAPVKTPDSNARGRRLMPLRQDRMMDLASQQLTLPGAKLDRLSGWIGFGDYLRARLARPRGEETRAPYPPPLRANRL